MVSEYSAWSPFWCSIVFFLGIRKNHVPRASRILGAPQRLVPSINHLGIPRIECEDVDHRPQVEHTPRPCAIQSNVCASHVAVSHDDLGIVRADGRRDHRPAAAGPDDRPGVKARSGRRLVGRQGDRRQQQCEKHSWQGTLPIGSGGNDAAPRGRWIFDNVVRPISLSVFLSIPLTVQVPGGRIEFAAASGALGGIANAVPLSDCKFERDTHLVWRGGLRSTTAPKAAPVSAALSAERLKRLDRFLQKYVDDNQIAGAVALVLRDGNPVYERAVGWSDKEAGRKMRTDTIFRIASQSKAITSTAVMALMEEGKIGITSR